MKLTKNQLQQLIQEEIEETVPAPQANPVTGLTIDQDIAAQETELEKGMAGLSGIEPELDAEGAKTGYNVLRLSDLSTVRFGKQGDPSTGGLEVDYMAQEQKTALPSFRESLAQNFIVKTKRGWELTKRGQSQVNAFNQRKADSAAAAKAERDRVNAGRANLGLPPLPENRQQGKQMKLTKNQLQQIIQEEVTKILEEV